MIAVLPNGAAGPNFGSGSEGSDPLTDHDLASPLYLNDSPIRDLHHSLTL
jgi:hypothetical protein